MKQVHKKPDITTKNLIIALETDGKEGYLLAASDCRETFPNRCY